MCYITWVSLATSAVIAKAHKVHFLVWVWVVASKQVTRGRLNFYAAPGSLSPHRRCHHSRLTTNAARCCLARPLHGRKMNELHSAPRSCRAVPGPDGSGSNPNPMPTESGADWSCRRCCSDLPPTGSGYASHNDATVAKSPRAVHWSSHPCHNHVVVHWGQLCYHRSSPPNPEGDVASRQSKWAEHRSQGHRWRPFACQTASPASPEQYHARRSPCRRCGLQSPNHSCWIGPVLDEA